jgi:hypothetical protein
MAIILDSSALLQPTTALSMISRSMRLIGAVGDGETISPYEAQTGLDALNSMLDSLSLDELIVYQIQQEGFAITPNTGSYTIGEAGTFDTTRPALIRGGFFRDSSNNDYPFRVIELAQWDGLTPKNQTSFNPEYLYYSTAYPLGTINLWPVPSVAGTLYIDSMKQLQQFSNLNNVIDLPPGYKRMIEYNLAVEIAPEFERSVSAEVAKIAIDSKAAVMRINAEAPILGVDDALMTRKGVYNINRGY